MTRSHRFAACLVAALAAPFAANPAAEAGCSSVANSIALQVLEDGNPIFQATPGTEVTARVFLFNSIPGACPFGGGDLSVTLPDGLVVPLAGFDGALPPVPLVDAEVVSFDTAPFTLDLDDVSPGGAWQLRADYGSTSNQPTQQNGTTFTNPPMMFASSSTSLPILALLPPDCPGDTDGNGAVDVDDIVNVVLDFGGDGSGHNGDVDGSGLVTIDDIVLVILSFGPCL